MTASDMALGVHYFEDDGYHVNVRILLGLGKLARWVSITVLTDDDFKVVWTHYGRDKYINRMLESMEDDIQAFIYGNRLRMVIRGDKR